MLRARVERPARAVVVSTRSAVANPKSPSPDPSGDHADPFHRATWFATTPAAVSNVPPA
jgi:hypothetical protein